MEIIVGGLTGGAPRLRPCACSLTGWGTLGMEWARCQRLGWVGVGGWVPLGGLVGGLGVGGAEGSWGGGGPCGVGALGVVRSLAHHMAHAFFQAWRFVMNTQSEHARL